MAKSNPSKSDKPKAEEPAPAKKEAKPAAAAKSAKAAKPEATAKAAAPVEKPAPAKAAAAKSKKPAPAAKPATSTGTPLINASLVAQSAANMLVNRNLLQKSGGAKPESAGFRQLKESLSKPAAPASVPFLQSGNAAKKSNQPFGGQKQVGHNQTFGADVNRSGVPRRTGGG